MREADRAFVAEGVRVLRAALDCGALVEGIYVAPEGWSHAGVQAVVERAVSTGIRVFHLDHGVMERVADTVTPQPVCGVVGFLDVSLDRLTAADGLLLACVDVRDPGNLGAVLRIADASGADGVVCCGGTVDPYNSKVVRASAGSIFAAPLALAGEASDTFEALAEAGFRRLGTSAAGGEDYTTVDLTGRVVVVLGNEASGLPAGIAGSLDATVTVPMGGRAESLNVAMTAAVLCFEAARQRRSRLYSDVDERGQ